MTQRILRISAAFAFGTALFASTTLAQTRPVAPQSPYGGTVVEEIVARVNDQIITRSDYDRALKELDDEARQHGATMQEISEGHKDLLRSLIDQQLWLSKGKELGITGETELIKRLDEYRKQYNLETLEDLEKAAKEQGVSWEDFKANIRNGIITQLVMRDQVGAKIQFTPGEVQRYFEQHKQDYAQQESVHLSEILVAAGSTEAGAPPADAATLAAAKAKADDIEAKLHAGGDFAQLARSFSDGSTAAEGGDLGQFRPGALAKVLEDKTFPLKAGEFTEPIQTRQGYVILKVLQHTPGGIPAFKDVDQQVEEAYYMSRMEPAIREYLTTMREEAYVDVAPGYTDTGASPKQIKPAYSAYTPPAPKKKKKVERTRFRETTHTFRQKNSAAPAPTLVAEDTSKNSKPATTATMKPGKKEKIRFGKAPTKTLSNSQETRTEDAGAVQEAANTPPEPVNPLEPTRSVQKTRFSARAKEAKKAKVKTRGPQIDAQAPAPPDAAEVADRQVQSAPLGLSGDTAAKKKKKQTTTGDKTRLTDKNKKTAAPAQNSGEAPAAQVPPAQTPAPAPAPQPPAQQP
ncbi:MAG: peptidylprolyl isomerase [Terracidiphilus sp.]|jgi:peptidyl-prolyl cis-trans isomerase SurA